MSQKRKVRNDDDYGEWAVMSPIQGDAEAPYVISVHSSRKAAMAAKRRVSSAKRPYVKHLNPPSRRRVTSRRKKNPVRVAASMTGKSTGWLPAKAVRVVKGKGGQVRVDVKR